MSSAPTAHIPRLLDAQQFQRLREAQAADGRLDRAAAELGFADEEEALAAVAETLGLELVDLTGVEVNLDLLSAFPLKVIHRYGVFPLRRDGDAFVVATGDPFDLYAVDAVSA